MGRLWKKPTFLVLSSLVVLIMVAFVVGTVAPSTQYGATVGPVGRATEPPAHPTPPPTRTPVLSASAAGVMVPLIEPDQRTEPEEAVAIEATREQEPTIAATEELTTTPVVVGEASEELEEVEEVEEAVPTAEAVAAAEDEHASPTAEATEVPMPTEEAEEAEGTEGAEATEEMTPTEEPAFTPTVAPLEQRVQEATGPGWTIVPNGDVSEDGNPETIAYQPADIALSRTFADPLYRSYPWVVSELLIVQEGEQGELEYLLTVTPEHLMTYDTKLMTLSVPSEGGFRAPEAFLATYTRDRDVQLTLIPLTREGEPYMQSIGIAWDEEAGEYRLILSVNIPTPADAEAESEEPADDQ